MALGQESQNMLGVHRRRRLLWIKKFQLYFIEASTYATAASMSQTDNVNQMVTRPPTKLAEICHKSKTVSCFQSADAPLTDG